VGRKDNMTKKKKENLFTKLFMVLRDPAWNFASCFFTFMSILFGLIGLLGISSILAFLSGKLQILNSWLIAPIIIKRIYFVFASILGLVILISIIIKIVISTKSHNKRSIFPKNYYTYWGVLWKGSLSLFGPGAFVQGPFCTQHHLNLTIQYDDNIHKFSFVCPGIPEIGEHIIDGPEYNKLILPDNMDQNVTGQDLLSYDVKERINALWREEGKL
jgi:hypothetical protein